MKKILTNLTGVVFLIAILFAFACDTGKKQKASPADEEVPPAKEEAPAVVRDNSKKVEIFLKDTVIDGTMHLLMYDTRKAACDVIDNLTTVAYPGDTVFFKKAHRSNVKKVVEIVLEKENVGVFSEYDLVTRGLFKLIINPEPPDDTLVVKYDIVFTVNQDPNEWKIDPYLKIPPRAPNP